MRLGDYGDGVPATRETSQSRKGLGSKPGPLCSEWVSLCTQVSSYSQKICTLRSISTQHWPQVWASEPVVCVCVCVSVRAL